MGLEEQFQHPDTEADSLRQFRQMQPFGGTAGKDFDRTNETRIHGEPSFAN
jgi:hypothetical protein